MAILLASLIGFAVAAALALASMGRIERGAILAAVALGQGLFVANYRQGALWFGGDVEARTMAAVAVFLVIDYAVFRVAAAALASHRAAGPPA